MTKETDSMKSADFERKVRLHGSIEMVMDCDTVSVVVGATDVERVDVASEDLDELADSETLTEEELEADWDGVRVKVFRVDECERDSLIDLLRIAVRVEDSVGENDIDADAVWLKLEVSKDEAEAETRNV